MVNNELTLNESKKRFQQILEYTFAGDILKEEGEEEQDVENNAANDPNFNNGELPKKSPEGFNPQVQEPNNIENQDVNDNSDMIGNTDSVGDNSNIIDTEQVIDSDDEVIDISQLTDSQEQTEQKMTELGDKFEKVLKFMDKFADMIQKNDNQIEALKKEFEKRNPTQLEKLNMQTAHSYPFNMTPEKYWDEKEKTTNYRTGSDEKKEEYTITKDDLNNINWRDVANTLDDNIL